MIDKDVLIYFLDGVNKKLMHLHIYSFLINFFIIYVFYFIYKSYLLILDLLLYKNLLMFALLKNNSKSFNIIIIRFSYIDLDPRVCCFRVF